MIPSRLVIVRHQAPLRTIGATEPLTALSQSQLGVPRTEVLIDSRGLEEAIEGGDWRSSDDFVRSAAQMLRNEVNAEPSEVHYFTMAEVPHVVGIAAHFGDEVLVHAHDYNRDRGDWAWPSAGRSLLLSLSGLPTEVVTQSGEATLVVEISYPVDKRDVQAVVGDEVLAAIRISALPEATPGVVKSTEDAHYVREMVRQALSAIARYRPGAELIHLFLAAPVSVCFGVGQELRLRNGCDVMTYRFRTGDSTERYNPALLLTTRSLPRTSRALSDEERSMAADLRVVFADALEDVKAHSARTVESKRWYSRLLPHELQVAEPFETLQPLSEIVFADDRLSEIPRETDYGFSKERPRSWQLSDALVMTFFEASDRDRDILRRMARLFFYHEYLHDWQVLTKYTAEDVGSFANCLEAIDYMADTYAFVHQVDYAMTHEGLAGADAQRYLSEQIRVAIASFWSFESPPPNFDWQERRLRRYLNWYWRRVQIRDCPNLLSAVRTLSHRPSIEVAGFKYRTAGGRQYVRLNEPRTGDVPELGIVLEDGRFERRGTTTDLAIGELMRAFGEANREAIDRFFNSLIEHLKPTGGVFAP